MSEERLTLKQERFVEVMATQEPDSLADAARRAGYSDSSPQLATHTALENLNKPHIVAAIQERRATVAEQAGINAVSVLKRIENRASSPDTPAATAQRADEYLGDVLNLRDQGTVIDARSLTIAASTEDVKALARLIAGEDAT